MALCFSHNLLIETTTVRVCAKACIDLAFEVDRVDIKINEGGVKNLLTLSFHGPICKHYPGTAGISETAIK